jgi:hypothetical protein
VEVVDTLSVDASAVVPLIETEAGLRTHVAGLVAFEGALTAQVSATVPVNEFDGVTVTVTVLPVVAPGLTVMLPPFESEKLAVPLVPPPLGACQKSPQPTTKTTRKAALPNSRAHLQLFIAIPFPVHQGRCGPKLSRPAYCNGPLHVCSLS